MDFFLRKRVSSSFSSALTFHHILVSILPGTFLGVKAAGAWGWQPHQLRVPNVMKSGSLNLLEPSGPHRACHGTPLPYLSLFPSVTTVMNSFLLISPLLTCWMQKHRLIFGKIYIGCLWELLTYDSFNNTLRSVLCNTSQCRSVTTTKQLIVISWETGRRRVFHSRLR